MKLTQLSFLAGLCGCSFLMSVIAAPAAHDHDGKPCTGDHGTEAASAAHDHDGKPCTGDHGTEAASAAHDHDGKPCTGDHGTEAASAAHDHDGKPCTGDHGAEAAPADADGHDHGGAPCPSLLGTPFTVSQKAQESLALQYYLVKEGMTAPSQVVVGQLIIPPAAIESYSLAVAGRVTVAVKSAQLVKKGDLLYTVASPELVTLMNAVDEAKAQVERNTQELDSLLKRQQQLAALETKNSELDSSIAFKKAEGIALVATYKGAMAQFNVVTQGAELLGETLEVRAREAGCVDNVSLSQGVWAEQGATVLSLIDVNKLEFTGDIYAGINIQGASAQLALGKGETLEYVLGTVRASSQINPANQLRTVYFTPDEVPQSAYAGQVAQLRLSLAEDQQEGYLSVPMGAVVRVGVEDVVFVKDPHVAEGFFMKKVKSLPARQGWIPVKGLAVSDKVVTLGGNELKYAIPAKGAEKQESAAGHFHADGKFHVGEH